MESLFIWPDQPVLSVTVVVVVAVVVLYFARAYAHKLILSVTHIVHNALRLTSRSILQGEAKLQKRNREVLMASGAEAMEKKLQREFHRINNVVVKDLQAYPSMHRSMSDLITAIDDDYRKSTETPPPPPAWTQAVESVAKIEGSDGLMAHVLSDIKKAADKQFDKAITEYRTASGKRHNLLKKMAPYWRKMSNTLEKTDKTINGLLDRSQIIDSKMQQYEEILAKTDKAERTLSSSALTQFVIAGIVLLIAIGGAVVNFNLIALPMSEMVGGGTYIGPFQMNHIAALVIVLVEAAMGIFLMEAMRITNLFPILQTMEDRKRRNFMWVAFVVLLLLACVESSLAFMRDIMATERHALVQTLSGTDAELAPEMSWIPMVGQMVLGFILPFVLAFVAIPFESFIHSARTVIGILVAWLMRVAAFLLRFAGNIMLFLGTLLINAYDLLAFPLLTVERLLSSRVRTGVQKGTKGEVQK